MAKKKHYRRKSNSKVNIRNIALSNEDVIRDYSHLSKLRVNDSTRDWIETRMYELREEANVYEMNCISYFQNKGDEFIHQAPFVIDGNFVKDACSTTRKMGRLASIRTLKRKTNALAESTRRKVTKTILT